MLSAPTELFDEDDDPRPEIRRGSGMGKSFFFFAGALWLSVLGVPGAVGVGVVAESGDAVAAEVGVLPPVPSPIPCVGVVAGEDGWMVSCGGPGGLYSSDRGDWPPGGVCVSCCERNRGIYIYGICTFVRGRYPAGRGEEGGDALALTFAPGILVVVLPVVVVIAVVGREPAVVFECGPGLVGADCADAFGL